MVAETLRLVDKATGPIRKAAMGNGSGKKVKPGDKIPVRAASRAASLPANEQKKLAKRMKGKTTEEALEEVRKVEEKLGITTRGRQAKKSKLKLNLKELLVAVERRLKSALRHTPNSRTIQAQLDIIEVLKGEKDIAEALPSPGRKKAAAVKAKKKSKKKERK
jgi:hypothetical protein